MMHEEVSVKDLWNAQKEINEAKRMLEKAQNNLKILVTCSSTETLVEFMNDFYEAEKKKVITNIPELFICVNNELVYREDEDIEEEAPN